MPRIKGNVGAPSGIGASIAPPSLMPAVWGDSQTAIGAAGSSDGFHGVIGLSRDFLGVFGFSDRSFGMSGASQGGPGASGVIGTALGSSGDGVHGEATQGSGVSGLSDRGNGLYGDSSNGRGVYGFSQNGDAVLGMTLGQHSTAAEFISLIPTPGFFVFGQAGRFFGKVDIVGDFSVSGVKSFRIDHPLDPANKYLYHAAVESADLKNIYDGVVALDGKGEAIVSLPKWFGALNKNYRYQLTAIGAPSPNLHVAEELTDNRFKIAGGSKGLKVSWQVTGIRQDAWAKAHPMRIESKKTGDERGRYLHPELYAEARSKNIESVVHPEILRQINRAKEMKQVQKERSKKSKQAHKRTSANIKMLKKLTKRRD